MHFYHLEIIKMLALGGGNNNTACFQKQTVDTCIFLNKLHNLDKKCYDLCIP